jgi:hypothetical protein
VPKTQEKLWERLPGLFLWLISTAHINKENRVPVVDDVTKTNCSLTPAWGAICFLKFRYCGTLGDCRTECREERRTELSTDQDEISNVQGLPANRSVGLVGANEVVLVATTSGRLPSLQHSDRESLASPCEYAVNGELLEKFPRTFQRFLLVTLLVCRPRWRSKQSWLSIIAIDLSSFPRGTGTMPAGCQLKTP